MPRKSIYDIAALAVVVWLAALMLGVVNQMCSYRPEPDAEAEAPVTEQGERVDPMSLSREERDLLRDRDGVVWGVEIDWAALYPPKEEPPREETAFDRFAAWVEEKQSRNAPYEERAEALEQLIDDYATDYAPDYQKMVEFANRYDAFIGWDIADIREYNPVVMAEDNYFVTCTPPRDRAERAAEVVALRDFCAERGMEHLYVTTPNSTCRDDKDINDVLDFYNRNADQMQKLLREAGVNTIDLRDELHAAGMDHHASFYQTDHHWLPETGRWAAGVISRRLNEDFGFRIDTSMFEARRWRADVFHDYFLGSLGKKVTLARARPEDFKLFYPKFATRFHIEIPSLDLKKTGGFSVFYRYNVMRLSDVYEQSAYSAYFYGDRALTRVHNLVNRTGKRVLVLGHSYDNCVLPFLALGIEYLDSIDLREFTGDLQSFLEKNHYDLVIELYTE